MITTDTGAKKIEGTDNWRQIFDIHNDSVDAYDANVAALQDALGIVVNGNQSAVSASSGQFIILKNSSIVDSGDVMLADGLYTAAKAIPANTVIDKTYLTAVSGGGLNSLNSNIAPFAGKSVTDNTTSTALANNADIPTNRTVRNAIYNGLDKSSGAGFALDARQGSALNTKITNLKTTTFKTFTAIASGQTVTQNTVTVDVSYTGYIPVSVGFQANQYAVNIMRCEFTGANAVTVGASGMNSSTIVKITVMYLKTP